MDIFDAHCDVLYKMWLDTSLNFQDDKSLHITYNDLRKTGSKVQCFAIYIPEQVRPEEGFQVALEMIDIFYNKILATSPLFRLVRTKEEVEALTNNEIGTLLTLEGCDVIGRDLTKLRTLFRLGVSSIGLTWNYANAVADGVLEKRGAGLSLFGKEVVRENNKSLAWTDVSHVCERGFWDVMELADFPIASHSNARALCDHPRNLYDDQIKRLIEKDGMIGITFVPQFLTEKKSATISDVLNHVEHICSLGGEYSIGFGSDFDGITNTVKGLENYVGFNNLIESLINYYSEEQVKRFLFQNFVEHLPM